MMEISDEEEMDTSALFNEIQELLATCQQSRAACNRLKACTCTKGKGPTRKSRRLCDHCQTLAGFGSMRRKLEELKERFRPDGN